MGSYTSLPPAHQIQPDPAQSVANDSSQGRFLTRKPGSTRYAPSSEILFPGTDNLAKPVRENGPKLKIPDTQKPYYQASTKYMTTSIFLGDPPLGRCPGLVSLVLALVSL
jgi:hypothetical protein